jgi:hypothetical protein
MTDLSPHIMFLQQLIAFGREGEASIQRTIASRLEALGCSVDCMAYEPADVVLKHEFASGSPSLRASKALVADEASFCLRIPIANL